MDRIEGVLMWPWEHLAVGYVAYALWRRGSGRPRPTRVEVGILALATQFPDLIDKPLGWGTRILPSGTSFAHSLLIAIPIVVIADAVARRYGRGELGTVFAIGYLLHLPGDACYSVLFGGEAASRFLLWPLLSAPAAPRTSVLSKTGELLVEYRLALASPAGPTYLLVEGLLLASALTLWILDGTPGIPSFRT